MPATQKKASPRRRPIPLSLSMMGGYIRPTKRAATKSFNCEISEAEYDALQKFIHSIHQWTGRTVTQKSVVRTAMRDYLKRNRSWVEMKPDALDAAD